MIKTSLTFFGILCLGLGVGPLCSQEERASAEASEGGGWALVPTSGRAFALEGIERHGKEISGIARGADGGSGFLVVDEGGSVVILEFLPEGAGARAAGVSPVLPDPDDEADFEGAAFDGGWFYAVGSHGVSKKKGEARDSRRQLVRFQLGEGDREPGSVGRTDLLPVVREVPELAAALGRPLQQNGLNIEGLAARGGKVFVGFRSPTSSGNAFVLELEADALFAPAGAGVPSPKLHRLPLGTGVGIRAMEAAGEGILLVSGNAGSGPNDRFPESPQHDDGLGYSLWWWVPETGAATLVGKLPDDDAKAEALLVLDESSPSTFEILTLSDGIDGGGPRRFTVSRPAAAGER